MKPKDWLRYKWLGSALVERRRPAIVGELDGTHADFGRSVILDAASKVIDCGANIGKYTSLFRRTGATVFAFEPDPNIYPLLVGRFKGIGNVHLFNQALGARDGTERLYFHKASRKDPIFHSVSSSLCAEKSNVAIDSFHEVAVVRLADFVLGHDRIDLVKMDIEGMEFDVLEDLIVSGAIERIGYMVIETHIGRLPGLQEKSDRCQRLLQECGLAARVNFGWR